MIDSPTHGRAIVDLFDESDLARATDVAESAFLSLVVGRPILEVTRPEAVVTLRRYGDSTRVVKLRLMSVALWRCLGDRVVTQEETRALAHLQWLLDYSEDDAMVLRERFVYPYFQNAAASLIQSGFSQEAMDSLSALGLSLRLSIAEASMLMSRAASSGFAVLPASPE